MDPRPSLEMLESTHTFPGLYRIKAIGRVEDAFQDRVLAAIRGGLAADSHIAHSSRSTPDGHHIALTLDVDVESAEQVRALYAKIQELEGLRFLL